MALHLRINLRINGVERFIENVEEPAMLHQVLLALGLKADRIAVEHNGVIAPRAAWTSTAINAGDRLEIVHFVGGGATS